MILVNTDYITGKELETIGIVHGHAGLGIIRGLLEPTRNSLVSEALKMNADAVINIRYTFTPGANGGSGGGILIASGTAVRFI